MFYLLDTGSASDYVYRRGNVYLRAQSKRMQGHRIGIAVPVLGELWAGVENSASSALNRAHLLRELPSLKIWPFDNLAAREYGRVFAVLKRLGYVIQQIDMQIAAVAFSLRSCTVVTKDADFSYIPGLRVEDWS